MRCLIPHARRMAAAWLVLFLLQACSTAGPVEVRTVSRRAGELPAYVRVVSPATNVVELQVAVRQLTPRRKKQPVIWLTGAMHIGEAAYYQALQQHLDKQGLVLYEGVSARPARPAVSGATDQTNSPPPFSQSRQNDGFTLQQNLADSLGLVFQLDAINYRRAHFANSDLSLGEIQKLIAEPSGPGAAESETPPSETFAELMQAMDGSSVVGLVLNAGIRLLSSSPKLRAMGKLAMVEALAGLQAGEPVDSGMPEDLRKIFQVLIEARNSAVLRDVRVLLKRPRAPASVAIFYGAAHMPDFENRLTQELRYRPGQVQWFTAFSVDLHAAGITAAEAELIRSLVRTQMRNILGGQAATPADKP